MYTDIIEQKPQLLQNVQYDIKDVVFDYFNIITKEYEMAYEKWRNDPEYQKTITEIKKQVDDDFIDKRFEDVPPVLTQAKCEEIVQRKQSHINTILMQMLQGGQNGGGQFNEKSFMIELMKFDDQMYIEEGFRREHIDKAVTSYGIDKQQHGAGGDPLGGIKFEGEER